MRRALVPLISLLMLVPHASAIAATKAGSKCTKPGKVTTVASTKLVCTKVGKSLVWKVAKPAIIPAPTYAQPDFDSLGSPYGAIVQRLVDEAWTKVDGQPVVNYSVKIEPGYENAPIWLENAKLMDSALRLVAVLGAPVEKPFTIVVAKHWSFVQESIPSNYRCRQDSWVGASVCGGDYMIFNIDHFSEWVPTGLEPMPAAKPAQQGFARVMAHEMAHESQIDLLKPVGKNINFFPAWLREGGPEVISVATYARANNMTYLQARARYLQFTPLVCREVKINELLMSGNHPNDCQGVNGLIATEVLIGTAGKLSAIFDYGRSKMEGYGPGFNEARDGLSEEAMAIVLKEMFNIDLAEWGPKANAEIYKWAPITRNW